MSSNKRNKRLAKVQNLQDTSFSVQIMNNLSGYETAERSREAVTVTYA